MLVLDALLSGDRGLDRHLIINSRTPILIFPKA